MGPLSGQSHVKQAESTEESEASKCYYVNAAKGAVCVPNPERGKEPLFSSGDRVCRRREPIFINGQIVKQRSTEKSSQRACS